MYEYNIILNTYDFGFIIKFINNILYYGLTHKKCIYLLNNILWNFFDNIDGVIYFTILNGFITISNEAVIICTV